MKKISFLFITLQIALLISITSCQNPILSTENKTSVDNQIQEIIIGDEIIYGDSFSLQDVYDEAFEALEESSRVIKSRSTLGVTEISEFTEDDFDKFVYFSVLPTSSDSLKKINEVMGYLNPTELDKEIIQACDAEKIIFKSDVEITEETNPDEIVNFNIKYYYISKFEDAEIISTILEGYEVIEEFEMLNQTALTRLQSEYEKSLDYCEEEISRGIFGSIGAAIKKAAKKVSDFLIKPYNIKGSIQYTVNGITVPAYGINISNECLLGKNCNTDKNGNFSLGSRTDSAGLCFLWVNYENNACKLSNLLGVTAATLVKTDWPSKLTNIKISAGTDYANAKMSICDDLLRRSEDEKTRHSNVPKATVWTTPLGKGVSSAPCFGYLSFNFLPDILLTGVTAQNMRTLETLHHEYTHFLHCAYANNKDNFWLNIVASEIGCTIETAATEFLKLFNSNIESTSYVGGIYDFTNPYVCFAENLAEWYSYVGCYGQGTVGRINENYKGYGTTYHLEGYDNMRIFSKLIQNFFSNELSCQQKAFEFITLVDKYNITTFSDFYTVLLQEYPTKKSMIQSVFKTYYNQHGFSSGNVIKY